MHISLLLLVMDEWKGRLGFTTAFPSINSHPASHPIYTRKTCWPLLETFEKTSNRYFPVDFYLWLHKSRGTSISTVKTVDAMWKGLPRTAANRQGWQVSVLRIRAVGTTQWC